MSASMANNNKVTSGDVLTEDEVFLAVVIADSYNKLLQPCTLNRSRVLVPLANRPLIDYTLAFLSLAGIQEVIIYCTSSPKQIKEYILSSKWPKLMSVKVIINEDAQSVGDALRDLDDKQMISTDFVLVNGDLVANLDLKACLDVHRQTRDKDKDAILTKIMKKCPPGHRVRSPNDRTLYALNKSTNQILSLQKVGGAHKVKLPTELIRDNKELQLRYDLLDCHVIVCAAMIPSLLTDNFDYQTMDDVIHGVLGNQEILGSSMHIHILEDGYAARASDFYSYKTVSRDVVEKWAYPFCSDRVWCNLSGKPSDVRIGNIYTSSEENFKKNCVLGKNVIIGDKTTIGEGTVIKNSVIGDSCVIGAEVVIRDSFVFSGARIEDNCVVANSILCEDVTLLKNTELLETADTAQVKCEPDYVLGREVQLGPDIKIQQSLLLTSSPTEDEWGELSSAFTEGGKRAKAFLFIQPTEEDADESDDGLDAASAAGDEDDDLVTPDTELFYNEVLDTLERAGKENISAENIILDINSLKHAYNIQISEVNHMVIQAALDRPIKPDTTSPQLLTSLKPLLKLCLDVFKNYYRSESSQRECLDAVQEFVLDDTHKLCLPIVCQVLMYFYQNDVIEEDVITKWYEECVPSGPLKNEVKKLMQWFEEAESDSESD